MDCYLTRNPEDFQILFHPVFEFLNQTPDRVPLTDWYDTITARQVGFQSRSVVGGVYMKLLANPGLWEKWVAGQAIQRWANNSRTLMVDNHQRPASFTEFAEEEIHLAQRRSSPIRLNRVRLNHLQRLCSYPEGRVGTVAAPLLPDGPLSKWLLQRDSIDESVIAWLYLRRREHQSLFRELPFDRLVAAEHLDRLDLRWV